MIWQPHCGISVLPQPVSATTATSPDCSIAFGYYSPRHWPGPARSRPQSHRWRRPAKAGIRPTNTSNPAICWLRHGVVANQGRTSEAREITLRAAEFARLLAKDCGGAVSPALAAARVPLPFTRREHEIAKLLSHGLSNRDIAEAMSVSVRTVEGHIYQASAKAGVSSRSELATLVQRFTELEVGSERGQGRRAQRAGAGCLCQPKVQLSCGVSTTYTDAPPPQPIPYQKPMGRPA